MKYSSDMCQHLSMSNNSLHISGIDSLLQIQNIFEGIFQHKPWIILFSYVWRSCLSIPGMLTKSHIFCSSRCNWGIISQKYMSLVDTSQHTISHVNRNYSRILGTNQLKRILCRVQHILYTFSILLICNSLLGMIQCIDISHFHQHIDSTHRNIQSRLHLYTSNT